MSGSGGANADLARRAFTRFASGDLEGTLELMHEEIIFVPLASDVTGEPFFGHEGMRAWRADRETVWDKVDVVAETFEAVGDRVLAAGHIDTRGRSGGVEIETPAWWVLELRDGKISRIAAFADEKAARAAAEA